MHSLPLLLSPFASTHVAAAASLLIASVWQGLLLTGMVALSLRLLPGISAATRSALWVAVLLLLLALPFLPLVVASSATTTGQAVWHAEEAISVGLVSLWITASLMRLGQLAGNVLRLRGIVRRAIPVAVSEDLAGILAEGSRRVMLCSSDDIDRPSVAGFFRPRILLPPALLGELSEAELVQVVLHEAEHLRRYDDWVNLLQQASLALFPLNPALFWLNRRLSLERELACDDGVLQATGARKAYAACLARVAEHSLVRQGVALALGVLGDWIGRTPPKAELSRRVERILQAPAASMGRAPRRLATAGVLCGLLGGATLLAHSPALVSFTPETPNLAAAAMPPALEHLTARPVAATESDRTVMMPAIMHLPATNPAADQQHLSFGVQRVQPQTKDARKTRAGLPHGTLRALHATQEIAAPQQSQPHRPSRQPAPWRLASLEAAQRSSHQGSEQSIPAMAVDSVEHVDATPRLVPVLFHEAGVWYTAVPTQGGWLIIEL